MLDEFFVRALVAGVGVAIIAGPLGCVVVWRRLAYFGDTLSHAALLGVALALLVEIDVMVAVFLVSLLIAGTLLMLRGGGRRREAVASDALLGLLSHSALAISLVALAFMTEVRVDLMSFLFGDILAVSWRDILVIYLGGAAVLACLLWVWRALFAATVSRELAEAEGMAARRADIIFMLATAAVIAAAIKLVGALLITALLIIPAVTARRFAASPEQMAMLATGFGCAAVIGGLFASLEWDTPSGPTIVATGAALFAGGLLPLARLWRGLMRGGNAGKQEITTGERDG